MRKGKSARIYILSPQNVYKMCCWRGRDEMAGNAATARTHQISNITGHSHHPSKPAFVAELGIVGELSIFFVVVASFRSPFFFLRLRPFSLPWRRFLSPVHALILLNSNQTFYRWPNGFGRKRLWQLICPNCFANLFFVVVVCRPSFETPPPPLAPLPSVYVRRQWPQFITDFNFICGVQLKSMTGDVGTSEAITAKQHAFAQTNTIRLLPWCVCVCVLGYPFPCPFH